MRRIILALLLVIASMGGRDTAAQEFVDFSTQHQMVVPFDGVSNPLQLHICPNQSVMIGVHVQANQFACERAFKVEGAEQQYGPTAFFYGPADIKPNADPTYTRMRYESHGMGACPPGTAMVGLHAVGNVLACVPVPESALGGAGRPIVEFMVDPNTYRGLGTVNMHVCPKGWFMVGIHEAKDLLLCGRLKMPK